LTILTWNVFLMPAWLRESPRNRPRAAAIAETLLGQDFDILCLQKVFDSDARDVLSRALASRYPYCYGPANDCGCLKLSSGVCIWSRQALSAPRQIQFGECASWECFSRKGALLVSAACGDEPFCLIATHLQGEEGPRFTPEHQAVRDQQMLEIRERLIRPHLPPRTPLVLCGDFGTPRLTSDGAGETDGYRHMLGTLDAENGRDVLITLNDSKQQNQLARDDTVRQNELDYILVRQNGGAVVAERRRHIFRRGGWDAPTERIDLSYRYAVSARLVFG
jgi:endonuclease/exonuclease/phosphatase family metal-dependent hydrolase